MPSIRIKRGDAYHPEAPDLVTIEIDRFWKAAQNAGEDVLGEIVEEAAPPAPVAGGGDERGSIAAPVAVADEVHGGGGEDVERAAIAVDVHGSGDGVGDGDGLVSTSLSLSVAAAVDRDENRHGRGLRVFWDVKLMNPTRASCEAIEAASTDHITVQTRHGT
uniref:Uncharacterized protein n=1 Tax=Oryza meridionalis TaxID=40149 RepID=A0A0E0ECU6_9ORYZ